MSRGTARSSDSTSSDARKRTTAKAPAEKKATKKTAKKTPAKKTSAKTAAKTVPAKKTSAATTADAPSTNARPTASRVAVLAAAQLLELTGRESEGVIGLDRTDDGWTVEVEVLELRRVPSTTDMLASYEVTVDEAGDLIGYRRLHRYVRGSPGDER